MNKINKTIAALTLSLFTATTGTIIAPATALAAPVHHRRPPMHNHHKRASKGDKVILGGLAAAGIVAAIVGSVKHHKANKRTEIYYN